MSANYQKGSIASIQICPGHRKNMRPVERARFSENLGIEGDMHAIADSSRQVLLIEKETLDRLGLAAGAVKENITTSGMQLMNLPAGTRLQLGPEVILEITKPCAPCSRMDEIRKGLTAELAGRRGILTRVVRGGWAAPGDQVTIATIAPPGR